LGVEQTTFSRIKYIGEIIKKKSPAFANFQLHWWMFHTFLFALGENVSRKKIKMNTSQCCKKKSTDANISGKSSLHQQGDSL